MVCLVSYEAALQRESVLSDRDTGLERLMGFDAEEEAYLSDAAIRLDARLEQFSDWHYFVDKDNWDSYGTTKVFRWNATYMQSREEAWDN